jgi:hypothetical protein
MGYTPKLIFYSEFSHHFMTSLSIQQAMKLHPSVLTPNNLVGGYCSGDTCHLSSPVRLLKMEAVCSSETLTAIY